MDHPLPGVGSIFFGGGTPSLMKGRAIEETLAEIATHWPLADCVEITLEANPSSADAGRFCDYRRAGINRLSVGVQALNDCDLRFLGRLHDVAEARKAVALATSLFDRVSIDLIYARPRQTAPSWRAELREALAFGTGHLSLYQLTIEDGTPFAALARSGTLHPICDDSAADLYEITQEVAGEAGLPAYEISNHARPGQECRHNLNYWRYGAYVGVGPGAQGRVDVDGVRIATSTERLPERWIARVASDGHGFTEFASVSGIDAAREHLLMNLRLAEGIDLTAWRARWGLELDAPRLAALVDDGFLRYRGSRLAATRKGRLVLNALIAALANETREFRTRTPEMSLAPG
jgi:oxygen-independent coproporphyrinogen-3 oxidase